MIIITRDINKENDVKNMSTVMKSEK